MVNSVSFGSTFKVHENNLGDKGKLDKHFAMTNFCEFNGIKTQVKEEFGKPKSPISMPSYSLTTTMVAPDHKDEQLQAFFALNGIKYKKIETKDLMKPKSIENRVEDAPKGMKKVNINVDKLITFLEQQPNNNLNHCESDYNKYFKEKTDFMLKSGDEITATTMYLTPYSGHEEMLEYIKNYGKDNINADSFFCDFIQRKDEPDHCIFFAMRDAGIENIPVYMNKNTLEMSKALGLIEQ